MRVFLLNSKLLSEINRKEEMTDDTYLITDQEADIIQYNLDNEGYFWVDDKNQLRVSGKRPNDYSVWNEEIHQWEVDQNQLNEYIATKKESLWNDIKMERELILQSGVKMILNGEGKWFHTDIVSQQSYDRAKDFLKDKPNEKVHWKTMDNSFVELSFEDLKTLTDHIFITGQRVFQIAEEKRAKLFALTNPTEIDLFDVKSGWVEVFKKVS